MTDFEENFEVRKNNAYQTKLDFYNDFYVP